MMWLIFRSLVVIFTVGTFGQDIMFPVDDIDDRLSGNKPTLTERIPIYVPDRCPVNMLLYPGDGNTSVWECDCKAGFLYFPMNNSCHEPYTRGPCPPQNYVILRPGQVIPQCERNPCPEDGYVLYDNTCYKLRAAVGPCSSDKRLTVNVTTFQLECAKILIDPLHIIDAPTNRCPPGSRRNTLGQCRKVI